MESYIEEFVRIVETGSVSAAAREFGRPRASMSRRLARLEAEYGVQLLHRETHRQNLTQAGKELYGRARKIASDLAEARQAVAALDAAPRGVLRVGLPAAAGIEMLLAQAFLEAYPEVTLEFMGTHTHDDLLTHGIDVALRAGPIDDENLIGRKLIEFPRLVTAAPALLERHGIPTLETLDDFPCVLSFDNQGRPITEWERWGGGTIPVRAVIRSNSVNSRLHGARLGLGLAMLSERLVRPHLESGELVHVLPELGSTTQVRLVWLASEFTPPKVSAFVEVATEVIGCLTRRKDERPEASDATQECPEASPDAMQECPEGAA